MRQRPLLLARRARRTRPKAGTEQRQALHALGCAPNDFQRDAASHRMAGERERRRRIRNTLFRHGRKAPRIVE